MSFSTFFGRFLKKSRRTSKSYADAAAQVASAYEIVLGRAADEVGLKTYSEKLASDQETILGIVQAMLNSPEGQALRRGGGHQDSVTIVEVASTPEPERMPETDSALEREIALEMDRSQKAELVNRLYRIVLNRDADEAGLAHHVERLVNNETDLLHLVQAFLASDEFAVSFLRHRNVARFVVKTLLGGLTSRPPSADSIETYSNAMMHGYSLTELLTELKASPEFDAGSQKVAAIELAILAQELIAVHLAREGCVIGLPPMALQVTPIPASQMAALIRTIAMLNANKSLH